MNRAAALLVVLVACGKTASPEERPSAPTALPDPSSYEASLLAYESGLAARDRGEHALAEANLVRSAHLRRPNGLAFARAGIEALAQHDELRASDLFRQALVDLEEETHARPHVSAHVPLACWGIHFTSVEIRWEDRRHLELRCPDGVSLVDVAAHEEVERRANVVTKPRGKLQTTPDGALTIDPGDDGRITVLDAKTGRVRAVLQGESASVLDDGGIAVTSGTTMTFFDGKLIARRRIAGVASGIASPDGRFVAHLVALPNPYSDAFHELAPRVRVIASGEEIDLSDLLQEPKAGYVRGSYVIGRATSPGVITRSTQRFAWSMNIDGDDFDWNDEIRCDGDLNAQQNDLLRCLSPQGPLAMHDDASTGDAHCRVGRYVLPLVVCSVASSPSRTPLVAR